jgi:hypothetical protein
LIDLGTAPSLSYWLLLWLSEVFIWLGAGGGGQMWYFAFVPSTVFSSKNTPSVYALNQWQLTLLEFDVRRDEEREREGKTHERQ